MVYAGVLQRHAGRGGREDSGADVADAYLQVMPKPVIHPGRDVLLALVPAGVGV